MTAALFDRSKLPVMPVLNRLIRGSQEGPTPVLYHLVQVTGHRRELT